MKIYERIEDWMAARKNLSGSVGFVPTMGALHAGHASLLTRGRFENDHLVLSIYVNPTQFNNPDDLSRYPITLKQDLEIAQEAGVDFVLLPKFSEIYPDQYRYRVSESEFSTRLCGAHRPGHFDGVLTVVMKLLNLTRPDRAYFGEKDFQQLELIRGMVAAFFMNTEIVACPTLREADGLAMSSRNLNLDYQARKKAPLLAKILTAAATAEHARAELRAEGFQVDYVEDMAGRRLAAAALDGVRLIDNVAR